MKLLICTQKMDANDPILGFFVRWVQEFAKHCEKITVICLEKGLPREIEQSSNFSERKIISQVSYDLPENVKVLSLGKEQYNGGLSHPRPFLEEERNEVKRRKRCGRGWPWIRIKYIFNFYKYIWQERKNYNTVFVHMNPIYVILGGLFWKNLRINILRWKFILQSNYYKSNLPKKCKNGWTYTAY